MRSACPCVRVISEEVVGDGKKWKRMWHAAASRPLSASVSLVGPSVMKTHSLFTCFVSHALTVAGSAAHHASRWYGKKPACLSLYQRMSPRNHKRVCLNIKCSIPVLNYERCWKIGLGFHFRSVKKKEISIYLTKLWKEQESKVQFTRQAHAGNISVIPQVLSAAERDFIRKVVAVWDLKERGKWNEKAKSFGAGCWFLSREWRIIVVQLRRSFEKDEPL